MNANEMTREERALKIAELEGWDGDNYSGYLLTGNNLMKHEDLIHIYSSFNGLMPIVERVNKEFLKSGKDATTRHGWFFVQYPDNIAIVKLFLYTITHEHIPIEPDTDLIDALQEAIIKYYELREKQG